MSRPSKNKRHLYDKYHELAWALSYQDYSNVEIGVILNRDKSVIKRLIDRMPKGWMPKWTKVA